MNNLEVKKILYGECDLADHEESNGEIYEHWHCKYVWEKPCLKLHHTKEEAEECLYGKKEC